MSNKMLAWMINYKVKSIKKWSRLLKSSVVGNRLKINLLKFMIKINRLKNWKSNN
jgi:hypothetical protein